MLPAADLCLSLVLLFDLSLAWVVSRVSRMGRVMCLLHSTYVIAVKILIAILHAPA